jgi:carboxyl-terminal processing protease
MTTKTIVKSFVLIIVLLVFSAASFVLYWYKEMLAFQSKFGSKMDYARDPIYREAGSRSWAPKTFDERARLFFLCKVWGFLKYYHQRDRKTSNVDSVLFSTIPVVKNASKKEYRSY